MSLTATDKGGSGKIEILPEDTYSAVCYEVIDLGLQYNQTFGNVSRKVLIGWELPDVTVEIDGLQQPRVFSKQYTMSLNEKATLRKDLVSWRGKQFTDEELEGFDLGKLIGVPCLLQIVHTEKNGRKYANLASVTKIPKAIPRPRGALEPILFDLDESPMEKMDMMPGWISDKIKESETYKNRMEREMSATEECAPGEFVDLEDDEAGELPF